MIACLMQIVLQWLWDTLTLFNADKTGNPLLLVALLGRLFLIALAILVPMGAAAEINHRWRRRRESLRQFKPTGKPD
jgi:hypothetical protein